MARKPRENSVQTLPTRLPLPTHQDIASRAYELYLQRGADHGSDLQDWLRAEAELRGRDRQQD